MLETKVISQNAALYNGWPTVCRRANGQLVVTCSGGREAHVCPFGRVEMMTSNDEGKSWTYPRVLLDGAIDDRDSGVLETAKGTLLVTTFTSLAYEPTLGEGQRGEELAGGKAGARGTRRTRGCRPRSARSCWACGRFARPTAG